MYSVYMFVGVSVYACICMHVPNVLRQDWRFARRPFDVVYCRKSILPAPLQYKKNGNVHPVHALN